MGRTGLRLAHLLS
ncbi:unnamed protein product [Linum tenue]|uniref:Uncharacterized protein n=1 Tax=Linum tenue TaxID=586396 RepID=A0AAV0H1A1_9ROSI|nr:unnamed protein product [Linum tenue]CAI0378575.1 unnamed protein product [Linum tenue]